MYDAPTEPLDIECLRVKRLTFIHLNIHSILPKLDEIRTLTVNTKVAVIGITKTCLDESVTDSEAEIPDYMILGHNRNHKGGGVCVYIQSDIALNARNDIGGDLETMWAEIYLPKTKPILVGVCYRPPKQLVFFSLFENTCMTCQNIQIQNVYYWVILIQIINK